MKITHKMVNDACDAVSWEIDGPAMTRALTAALATQPDREADLKTMREMYDEACHQAEISHQTGFSKGFERAREMAAEIAVQDLEAGTSGEVWVLRRAVDAIRSMEMPDE